MLIIVETLDQCYIPQLLMIKDQEIWEGIFIMDIELFNIPVSGASSTFFKRGKRWLNEPIKIAIFYQNDMILQ